MKGIVLGAALLAAISAAVTLLHFLYAVLTGDF